VVLSERDTPQRDYSEYLDSLRGAGTAAPTSEKFGGNSVIDVGNDFGRGPGTPGGRGTGNRGVRLAPWGEGGGGYSEVDISKILRGMPPERIAEIQRKMQVIGLLPENYKSFGFVENTMRSGFAELLDVANARNSTYATTLDSLTESATSATDTGPGSRSSALDEARREVAQRQRQTMLDFGTDLNTYKRSDPASVRVTAEEAFRQALGRKPRKAEMDRFVNAFLVNEKSDQKTVFDAGDVLAGKARDRAMESASILPTSAGGSGGSEADELWSRLQRMIADAPGKITPGPRSRDYATQVRLWNRYKAGKGPQAARPGKSKHGDGRANDLTYENDAVRAWALANAGKYGLAFPIYNPKLSRRMDESWHIELGDSPGDSYGGPAAGPVTPAPISQNVTAQENNMAAQALEFARSQNPVETRAYDIGQQFNSFLAILQRGIGL
jgi:hypothetical protein